MLYKIKNWEELYENNRSRKVKDLQWVPTPNRHDGDGFIYIMSLPDASEVYAGWMLILQVASRCHPRGTLVRGNGTPHTAASLAAKTRGRVEWFEKALAALLDDEVGWLKSDKNPQENGKAHLDVTLTSPRCHPSDVKVTKKERKKEGKERKERIQQPLRGWEEIYQAYPRKIGKKDAQKAILKALKAKRHSELLEATKAFSEAVKGADKKFIPHPSTWFNRGSYDDERSEWSEAGRSQPTGMDLRVSKEALRTRRDELRRKEAVIRGGNMTYGPHRDKEGNLLPKAKTELECVESQLKKILGVQLKI